MTEVHGHIIRYLLPGLSKGETKRLRQLAEEKSVLFIDPMLESNLRGIYASMVRHERTAYDDIIAMVGKTAAREMVRPAIERKLQAVTKHPHKHRNRRYK